MASDGSKASGAVGGADDVGRYRERVIHLSRHYLGEYYRRTLSAVNIALVVLSLVLVFEATLVASRTDLLSRDGFWEIFLPHVWVGLLGNVQLAISLFSGVLAIMNLKVPVPNPLESLEVPGNADLDVEWLAEELACERVARDHARLADAQISFSLWCAAAGTLEIVLAVIFVYATLSNGLVLAEGATLPCCVVVTIANVIVLAALVARLRRGMAYGEDFDVADAKSKRATTSSNIAFYRERYRARLSEGG